MPTVGLGTWKIEKDQCKDIVYQAIKLGYRHLDGACDYGNEKQVGEAIKQAIDEGLVTRQDLFVTSKLWNTYHHTEHVEPALKKTLSDMGLDYLDLYLMHFPISLRFVDFDKRYPPGWNYEEDDKEVTWEPVPVAKTWEAMEKLVDAGLVRSIGVSNFSGALMMDLLASCRIRPAVLQIEIHPYLQQTNYVRWLQEQNIVVTAYSSFGVTSYSEIFADFAKDKESLLEHSEVQSIADSHGKDTGQILLRWAVQRGLIVIPKSSSEKRLQGNKDLFTFELSDSDMEKLAKLNQNIRFNDPGRYANLPIFD